VNINRRKRMSYTNCEIQCEHCKKLHEEVDDGLFYGDEWEAICNLRQSGLDYNTKVTYESAGGNYVRRNIYCTCGNYICNLLYE
jgi:hypothetical protein